MSSKRCYNNEAFATRQEGYDTRDTLNSRLELGAFHAYNETFVDDEGCYDDEYVDFQEPVVPPLRFVRSEPKCRRSIAAMPLRPEHRRTDGKPSVAVGFHRDRYGSLHEHARMRDRYEFVGAEDASRNTSCALRTSPLRLTTSDPVDAVRKRYEQIEVANEEYVDYPEDRLGLPFPARESPLGSAGVSRLNPEIRATPVVTPLSTPRKSTHHTPTQRTPTQRTPTQRTSTTSTPTKISKRDSIILAPMLATLERQMACQSQFHRSAIISSPKKPIMRSPERTVVVSPRQQSPRQPQQESQSQSLRQSAAIGRSLPSLKYYSPAKLQSFNHFFESDFNLNVSPNRTPNKKLNTAIITPNMRSSIAPLLTPPRETHISSSPVLKSPSNFSKASWATLPIIHLPTELLCCVGFVLLAAGAISCILCFYILAITGRRYFLNFGAVAGFLSLLIGLFSFRTNKWKWLPHRNYITGYILLGVFSFLNAACLGCIVYAADIQHYALFDTLGGAVSGVSILVIVGAFVGLVTSHCCHRPPPDNRVSHSASGFIV